MSVALDECAKRSHLKLCQCGICVFNHTPYLACSPDELVDGDGIGMVKSPHTAPNKQVTC